MGPESSLSCTESRRRRRCSLPSARRTQSSPPHTISSVQYYPSSTPKFSYSLRLTYQNFARTSIPPCLKIYHGIVQKDLEFRVRFEQHACVMQSPLTRWKPASRTSHAVPTPAGYTASFYRTIYSNRTVHLLNRFQYYNSFRLQFFNFLYHSSFVYDVLPCSYSTNSMYQPKCTSKSRTLPKSIHSRGEHVQLSGMATEMYALRRIT
jgi:hypothetical protein